MDIPDEARKRIQTLYVNVTPGALRETLRECALEGAEIAARAAQVQILREVVEQIRQSKWTSLDEVGVVVARGTALHIARTIELKADELERS